MSEESTPQNVGGSRGSASGGDIPQSVAGGGDGTLGGNIPHDVDGSRGGPSCGNIPQDVDRRRGSASGGNIRPLAFRTVDGVFYWATRDVGLSTEIRPLLDDRLAVGDPEFTFAGVRYVARSPKPDDKRIARGLWWDRGWSLVEGCNAVSDACRNCWALRNTVKRVAGAEGLLYERYHGLTDDAGHWTGRVREMYRSLEGPYRQLRSEWWSIWNDLFHPGVETSFVDSVFEVIADSPWQVVIILTKRPEIALDYLDGCCEVGVMDNVLLGVTIEHQAAADDRAEALRQIAALGWRTVVSYEPALGPVDWGTLGFRPDWIIAGGENGPKDRVRKSDPAWFVGARNYCIEEDVPFFFKGIGIIGESTTTAVSGVTPFGQQLYNQTWHGFPRIAGARRDPVPDPAGGRGR